MSKSKLGNVCPARSVVTTATRYHPPEPLSLGSVYGYVVVENPHEPVDTNIGPVIEMVVFMSETGSDVVRVRQRLCRHCGSFYAEAL